MDYKKEYERLMDIENNKAAQAKTDAVYRDYDYNHACPQCGYCPHCGRGNRWPSYPRWGWNEIYCTTTDNAIGYKVNLGTTSNGSTLQYNTTNRVF